MARLAILLGRKHKEKQLTVLAGPDEERAIRTKFKELHATPGDLAHIELWTADAGRDNRKFFTDQKAAAAKAAAEKAAAAKAAAEKEAADKAAADKAAADKAAADKAAADKAAADKAAADKAAADKAAADKAGDDKNAGGDKTQSGDSGPAAPASGATDPKAKALPVIVPSLQEVVAAGYKKAVAEGIIATEQAKADAQKANPEITNEELQKVTAKK